MLSHICCSPWCRCPYLLLLLLSLPEDPTELCPGLLFHQQPVLQASCDINHQKGAAGVCQPRKYLGPGLRQSLGTELRLYDRLSQRSSISSSLECTVL
ncbi:hypothetical protein NDU88_001841 [Pleurodeles waltl]|uniref:Secreted protein n=1 Tax=Pleurodeles waltl TaxID=8319 RepID=A0AAV7U849_PLEWA|nr:hypothetical protein NDU88_001841 [Pleurodeles waltl]